MGKVWVLDTETKGTGAEMVPLEKVLRPAASDKRAPRPKERGDRPGKNRRAASQAPASRTRSSSRTRTSDPLPPGHVRKKATGELGRVQAVDAKAGTAKVLWLREGRASTVALAAISRR